MFTHFSKADETDKTTTLEQIRAFLWMKEHLAAEGMEFTYYHCANSASIIDMPKLGMNLERAGISTYGLYPSDEVNKEAVPLRPAMELIAHVTYVKWIERVRKSATEAPLLPRKGCRSPRSRRDMETDTQEVFPTKDMF